MARRRRGQRQATMLVFGLLGALLAAGWWLYPRLKQPDDLPGVAVGPPPRLTSSRPEVDTVSTPPPAHVSEKGAEATPEAPRAELPLTESTESKIAALIERGRQAAQGTDLLAARSYFTEAIQLGAAGEQARLLRAELTRIGNETIFSPRVFEGDPLVDKYVIQSGDSLAKIAKQWQISADLLANVNNIRDKHLIRAGRTIKIVKGPFHAVVDKKTFTMDVYVQNTLVRTYKVGLGADDSTPRGEWRVSTKLENPTYYHPRGGDIIAADDPDNPLGERWIGLVGIGGEAVGQERYGIHGTIEPESIGSNTSLGCVRMYNEDVEQLYTMLVEKHSTVKIN